MITCTECGGEMEPLTKYIAGVFWLPQDETSARPWLVRQATIHFFMACQHKPAHDAQIRLGSKECVESFCGRNPEYVDEVVRLMSEHQIECKHLSVN